MSKKKQVSLDVSGMGSFVLFGMATALLMGLCLVWLNIERVDTAYRLRKMEGELTELSGLNAKLEVERDNLLSPHRLSAIAHKRGFLAASSERIRKIETREAPTAP
ncbi:MAG: hypothetical protein AB7D07_13230 [Desulfovibrionaceae bacterium]|jgi:cell division protein FtsL